MFPAQPSFSRWKKRSATPVPNRAHGKAAAHEFTAKFVIYPTFVAQKHAGRFLKPTLCSNVLDINVERFVKLDTCVRLTSSKCRVQNKTERTFIVFLFKLLVDFALLWYTCRMKFYLKLVAAIFSGYPINAPTAFMALLLRLIRTKKDVAGSRHFQVYYPLCVNMVWNTAA